MFAVRYRVTRGGGVLNEDDGLGIEGAFTEDNGCFGDDIKY